MCDHLNSSDIEIIDISPMGCRTGFYMSLIGQPNEQRVANAWQMAVQDVLNVTDQNQISELNKYQCGSYEMHSLAEAQQIAHNVIECGIDINKNEELTLPKEELIQLSS